MAKKKRMVEQKVGSRITFVEAAEWLANKDKLEACPDNINGKKLVNKTTLSFKEAIEFVEDLVESCMPEDDDSYMPEAFDITARLGIMTKYGNFEMPEFAEEAYVVIYDDYLHRAILREINWSQLDELCEAAKKKIEYRLSMNISTATSKINELIAKMDEVMSTGAGIFSGVDQSKANKLMQNLASIEHVDEKSIVDAFVGEFVKKDSPKSRPRKKTDNAMATKSGSDTIVLRKEDG